MIDRKNEHINQLISNLFRHESGKLVSVLTKILGTANINLAEDVVQDAIAEAINQWTYKGIPENPTGWLYKVAKNKAINFINRDKKQQRITSENIHYLQSEWTAEPATDYFFSDQEIADDQLRMIFTCSHPIISSDSQIALTLKTLCGFSIPEIARAFLTNKESINKRLVRAREAIRDNDIKFEVPSGNELNNRLHTVLETIYLLFNEGYNSSHGKQIIRAELCEEAIYLAQVIADHPKIIDRCQVHALLSLMLLNASRFNAREDAKDNIIDLAKQDRRKWNKDYIRKGIEYLGKSIQNDKISKYQILATISAHHCTAQSDEATDWKSILTLYENLSEIDNSPLVLLNKAVAVSKVYGTSQAIDDLLDLSSNKLLNKYPYYYSAIGEMYMLQRAKEKAIAYFEKAISLSTNHKETQHLKKKISTCKSGH